MRDRLVELLKETHEICNKRDNCDGCVGYGKGMYCERYLMADRLLENGVIVPPCKIGDTVYYLGGLYNRLIKSAVVEEIIADSDGVSDLFVTSEDGVTFENSIKIFFLTREEAERALKGGAE